MSAQTIRIVAIGGGGCTHRKDLELDLWIIRQLGLTKPRVGYLGTASRENAQKRDGFQTAYASFATIAEALAPDATEEQCSFWLQTLDLVYVGGGNTRTLLEAWRQLGWDRALLAAARRGVMMAGVSAGGMCWFEAAFSDADGHGYRSLAGLGYIGGSCCPHYSEEPQRKPAYAAAVGRGAIVGGIAIDDGVAVLCNQTGAVDWVSARPGAAAYHVLRDGEKSTTVRLPALNSL